MGFFFNFPFSELPGPGDHLVPPAEIPTPPPVIPIDPPIETAKPVGSFDGVLEGRILDVPDGLPLLLDCGDCIDDEQIIDGWRLILDHELFGLDDQRSLQGLVGEALLRKDGGAPVRNFGLLDELVCLLLVQLSVVQDVLLQRRGRGGLVGLLAHRAVHARSLSLG